ncbi:MAG: hypothetical protein IJ506_05155 [Clostridia bacterium]|nr:hypothetical protein [Clostridia bacterium]
MKIQSKRKYLAAWGLICLWLGIFFIIIAARDTKKRLIATGETVEISVLGYAGSSVSEEGVEYSLLVEGAEDYESQVLSGAVDLGGESCEALLMLSGGTATFVFEFAVTATYFVVDESAAFVCGEAEISFDQSYVCNFETQTVAPVLLLYNPVWNSFEENTVKGSCGVGGSAVGDTAVGEVEVSDESVSVKLTIDGEGAFEISASAFSARSFIVRKNTLFLSETAAYRFDVDYRFDLTNEKITPTHVAVSFYDGDSLVLQKTVEIGTEVTLADSTLFTGKGILLGLSDGTRLYPFGASFAVEETAKFYARYLTLKTEETASARLDAPYGVRFTTSFDSAEYAALLALDGVEISFGADITVDGSAKKVPIETASISLYEKDTKTLYHTALVGIKEENFALVYHCTPRVSIRYSDGGLENFKGEGTTEGRSYAQVFKAAYEELAAYDEETRKIISEQYEKVLSNAKIQPVVLVFVDGEQSTALSAEIAAWRAENSLKIGDQVNLTDFFRSLIPEGYLLDEDNADGKLQGVITERGLTIKVYYEKE